MGKRFNMTEKDLSVYNFILQTQEKVITQEGVAKLRQESNFYEID